MLLDEDADGAGFGLFARGCDDAAGCGAFERDDDVAGFGAFARGWVAAGFLLSAAFERGGDAAGFCGGAAVDCFALPEEGAGLGRAGAVPRLPEALVLLEGLDAFGELFAAEGREVGAAFWVAG